MNISLASNQIFQVKNMDSGFKYQSNHSLQINHTIPRLFDVSVPTDMLLENTGMVTTSLNTMGMS